MRRYIWQTSLYVGSALSIAMGGMAHAQGSIVFEPATGNYHITYASDGGMSETTYIPNNQIAPVVQSTFRLMENKAVNYRYAITNGSTAKRPVEMIHIDNVPNPLLGEIRYSDAETPAEVTARFAAENHAMQTPLNWSNGIDRQYLENGAQKNSRIAWSSDDTKNNPGIIPGNKVAGFGLYSNDLPGVMTMKLMGFGSGIMYADEGPAEDDPIRTQIDQLRDNDFIAKSAAVPAIAVPVPFDAAVMLDRIRTHVATWPGKQLLDPAFATQLDRYMVAAADAYRLNNTKAGKEHIKKIRELLEHEHKYLDHDDEDNDDFEERKIVTRFSIDRLAARVLDFDLRYVLKRTSKERD